MHAFYPLTLGHIANIILVVVVLSVLWLTFRKNKLIAFAVFVLYIFMYVLIHFINQSDNKYSDVSHGLFGEWNVPLFGICLLLVVGLQFFVLIINRHQLSTKQP